MLFWIRFGSVLGTVFGAFWTILGGLWRFENELNFKAKLERALQPKMARNWLQHASRRQSAGAGEGRGFPLLGEG